MRHLFVSLVLGSTALTPAFITSAMADTINATSSHIEAVTVYLQGAEVTRRVEVDIPAGSHTIALPDLTGDASEQSIQVEGTGIEGLTLTSVDARRRELGNDARVVAARISKIQETDRKIDHLKDENAMLDKAIADAETQKSILASLARAPLGNQSGTMAPVAPLDPAALGPMLDLVAQRLAKYSSAIQDAQVRQRAIALAIAELEKSKEYEHDDQTTRLTVSLDMEATKAGHASFLVRYRVATASWTPFYEAHLKTQDGAPRGSLELVRRAEIKQVSGEDWKDVALSLSTADRSGGTSVSNVYEDEFRLPGELAMLAMDVAAPVARLEKRVQGSKPALVPQSEAGVAQIGLQVRYNLAGKVTIPADGTNKRVRISTDTLDVALTSIAVPRNDLQAFYNAHFTLPATATALLPGVVALNRDGTYVGEGAVSLLNPGAAGDLGFGVDENIAVKRAEVGSRTGQEGILSTSNVEEHRWDMEVMNYHDKSWPVRLIDQVPFSTRDGVSISRISDMTPPDVENLDQQRGVLAWDFTLEPKASKTIVVGYKATWPEGKKMFDPAAKQ